MFLRAWRSWKITAEKELNEVKDKQMRLTNASVCLHVHIRAEDIVRVIVITVTLFDHLDKAYFLKMK